MHYFTTDEGYRLTTVRFNFPRTQVRLWVAVYDAYAEEDLKLRDNGVSIDPDIRFEAVKAVLTGKISQTQAAAKFKVAGSASVGKWMKVYSKHGEEGLRSLRVGKKRALHMFDDPRRGVFKCQAGLAVEFSRGAVDNHVEVLSYHFDITIHQLQGRGVLQLVHAQTDPPANAPDITDVSQMQEFSLPASVRQIHDAIRLRPLFRCMVGQFGQRFRLPDPHAD